MVYVALQVLLCHIIKLKNEYEQLVNKEKEEQNISSDEILKEIEMITDDLKLISIGFEQLNSKIISNRISISTYQEILDTIVEDLGKNKAALKLRVLGAELDIEVSKDKCPTCFQHIVDNLLAEEIKGPQLDLKEQIEHLNSQKKMLEKQMGGVIEENKLLEVKMNNAKKEISRKHNILDSLRKAVTSGTEMEKLYVRKQIYIENEVHNLEKFKDSFYIIKNEMSTLVDRFRWVDGQITLLPKEIYSEKDIKKIRVC